SSGEVIQYLRRRFGTDRVAQIGTYGTLGARAALRDVARVLGLPNDRVSEVIKSVEWSLNDTLEVHWETLRHAMERARLNPVWLILARRLEGLPRHRSTHAAGVIIAPARLSDWIYCHGDPEQGAVTDFDMGSLERLGFVKLDVLGLRTLSLLSLIEETAGLSASAMADVDGSDPETLKLLARGDTDGIFQLDGRGVKRLLKQMRPRSREEVMLVVALYRPGPMDAIGELLKRRQSGYARPDDPLESLLEETYGVMVYQEQLMAAVQHVAGFSLAEADLVRRAISKKDHSLLAAEGQRLVANMMERGYSRAQAESFREKIRAFGDYGFNKSHAASYGLLSYYLAYLKAHYPLPFWAAELSSHDAGERVHELMVQAVSQGIAIERPHINFSGSHFVVEGLGLRAGLSLIRGMGLESSRRIVEERKRGGLFRDAGDAARRLGPIVGHRGLEMLEMAGALEGLGPLLSMAGAQMQLFEVETAPTDMAGRVDAKAAFGFAWPKADGPIFIRLQEGVEKEPVMERVATLEPSWSGTVEVAVIESAKRVARVPGVKLRGDAAAIQALKELDGVQAAGRHVSLEEA
ncbi:MAG: DNA polymerase III subunit alpha, partial [Firmicutes bacterium]|nr:DNA polymerase III subunit alpha [Bacillota bacterium]